MDVNEESQMDKGFNDDELADIMNEIESLEHEFADIDQAKTNSIETKNEETQPVAAQTEVAVEKMAAEHEEHPETFVDSEMEEVLEELTEMSVEEVVPEKEIKTYDDNIHHIRQVQSIQSPVQQRPSDVPAQTSMSFQVEGEMKLNLNFCVGGQNVSLHVSDQGFEIELAGGAKFTLPLHHVQQGKKVA